MSFLYGHRDESPGKIDNSILIHKIQTEGIQNMQKSIDYFELPQQTWNSLVDIYRGGPAIILRHNGKVEIENAI